MSTAQTLLLGAIAGVTIFIGLPVARLRNVPPSVRSMLAAVATGILTFLLWDVLTAAVEPVEGALTEGREGRFLWRARARVPLRRPVARALARALHRDRNRPPQLLGGARDRPVCGARRAQPRDRARHRLRPPQRDRGL